MKLNDFENYIDETILDRGYDYYDEGRISKVIKQGDRDYLFIIAGTELYQVFVKFDDQGEIMQTGCDCPYDFGPICKHQAAAFYALADIVDNRQSEGLKIERAIHQSFLTEALDRLSKEQLITIVIEMAEKDEILKNSLMMRYSKGNTKQELQKCQRLMESIVRKYQGRSGYIEYRDADEFAAEMEELLQAANDTEDRCLGMDIASMLLIEAVDAFQYADDSDGSIGGLVSASIDTIATIVTNNPDLDIGLKIELFEKLLKLSDENVFDGWEDFRIELLKIVIEFADVESLRNKLNQKIETMIGKISGDVYKQYTVEALLRIELEIKSRYGTKAEVEEFIRKNLKYSSFRQALIDKYTKEKDFQSVIELALEGEKKDRNHAGLVARWKKIRYMAYKRLDQEKEQQQLAKELFFDGNFEYYQELKVLNPGNETELYHSLKQELKALKDWRGRELYCKLIVEAKDLDAIMDYVRENPQSIESYAEMLKKKYKDEVIEIYQADIKRAAGVARNRRDYQGICRIIKQYKKIAGQKNQDKIIQELVVYYKKRPAFVDELRKV
ncbi:MAG: SWIM zinc finger family protein [Acetobacterium sp.]|uniref:SWIM zinc finger family protein n=1 Tax=Acetobacterium sp. TaxID=1872094 RepID=UPI003242F03F